MDTNEVPGAAIRGPARGEVTLRDWLAINATDEEVARFRGAYDNPAGGPQKRYRHTIEQARYLYADAMLEARNK